MASSAADQVRRTLRLLVVDDHDLIRQGLRALLAADPSIEIAAEAATVREAEQHLRREQFDVIVLDVSLPDETGWDLLETIRASPAAATPVLILSSHDDQEYGMLALRSGAAGYLSKSEAASRIAVAIHRVAAGGRYISDAVAERLATLLVGGGPALSPHESLTPRELQVLLRLVRGRPLVEIADELHVSPKTVTTWRTRILEKLGATSNADLTRYAVRHRLIDQ
jgi:DNA-binding NarL/FixJ family response regulator